MSGTIRPSRNGWRRLGLRLGLPATAVAGLIVVRRRASPPGMPFADPWQRALAETRGEAEAARLVARAQARYAELYAGRPRPASRALRLHLERSMLPGLALYQTLREAGEEQEAALAELQGLMAGTVDGLRRLMSLLGRLPNSFALFRRLEPWVVRFGFPAEGWQMEPVENSGDAVAFNVHGCFYLDTLSSYGAPELTAVYCGGDDVVFPELAPSITWERTTTLARGGPRCDFRWCRGVTEKREHHSAG